MKRFLLSLALYLSLSAYAQAQLIIQQGKPIEQPAASSSNTTSTAAPSGAQKALAPVEATIEGTNFPASAITTPQGQPAPLTSTPAPNPALAGAPKIPADSATWPSDTLAIFVTACAKTNVELIRPCKCVIENIAPAMPHNEFVALAQSNAIESDTRYIQARSRCLGAPKQRQ